MAHRLGILTNRFSEGLWDRRLWPVVIAFGLLALTDFVTRIAVGSYEVSVTDNKSFKSLQFDGLGDALYEVYIAKLSNGQGVESNVARPIDDGPEVDQTLNMELGEGNGFWLTENYSYNLLGVFERSERIAVLDRVDLRSGAHALIEVKVGDRVDGLVISDIALNVLVLEEGVLDHRMLQMFERATTTELP